MDNAQELTQALSNIYAYNQGFPFPMDRLLEENRTVLRHIGMTINMTGDTVKPEYEMITALLHAIDDIINEVMPKVSSDPNETASVFMTTALDKLCK